MARKIIIDEIPEMKSGGDWISKAVNKNHVGYCTPMSKPTCTPHRKALAMRFKHGDLHKKQLGGVDPWASSAPSPDLVPAIQTPTAPQMTNPDPNAAARNAKYTNNLPGVSPDSPTNDQAVDFNAPMTMDSTGENQQMQGQQRSTKPNYMAMGQNLLGAGLLAGSYFNNIRQQRYNTGNIREHGMTSSLYAGMPNPQGAKGDYVQTGTAYGQFRPNQMTPNIPNQQYPAMQMGGVPFNALFPFAPTGPQYMQQPQNMQKNKAISQLACPTFEQGGTYDLDRAEIMRLKKLGYKIELL